jgi:hypothetical protein
MSFTATTAISTITIVKDSFMAPFKPVEAVDGNAPYVYSIDNSLPAGLSFNTSTGFIAGTATQIANVFYDITIVDATTQTSTSSFTLIVQSEVPVYLERIATALEIIATASISTGIRMIGPYDWLKPTEVYSWYNQDLSTLRPSTDTINTIVSDVNTITNNLPKFL